jgi:hypothetical protein
MTTEDGIAIAEAFIRAQDLKGHTVKVVEARELPRWPNEFSIIFELYSPKGNLIDGPIVVVVDKRSGNVRFLQEP